MSVLKIKCETKYLLPLSDLKVIQGKFKKNNSARYGVVKKFNKFIDDSLNSGGYAKFIEGLKVSVERFDKRMKKNG